MHLDIARRKGRCSNYRNPSSDFSGGVNATLELLPHVGHFLSLHSIYNSRAAYGATAAPKPYIAFPAWYTV